MMSLVRHIVLTSALLACASSAAFASDFVVTKIADTNDGACTVATCSLRDAIIAANRNPGADRVILGSGLTYTLTLGPADPPGTIVPGSGDLDIIDSLTIEGNGSTIDAAGLDRVFDIEGVITVTINNLTIKGGVASGFLSLGGGLYINRRPSRSTTASCRRTSRRPSTTVRAAMAAASRPSAHSMRRPAWRRPRCSR
jgi:CSLREA domain-containing protein